MTIHLHDAQATEALGAGMAQMLKARRSGVIYLEGDLGVGKTTLARGFLRALGVEGAIRSPTYTLMEPYRAGDVDVLHMDLYRLNAPAELLNLGLTDFPPDQTLWLVEWPQRGQGFLPKSDIRVLLSHDGGQRKAEIMGFSEQELAAVSERCS